MIRRALHKLAHLLMWNLYVSDDEFRDGTRVSGYRCTGCGEFTPWDERE